MVEIMRTAGSTTGWFLAEITSSTPYEKSHRTLDSRQRCPRDEGMQLSCLPPLALTFTSSTIETNACFRHSNAFFASASLRICSLQFLHALSLIYYFGNIELGFGLLGTLRISRQAVAAADQPKWRSNLRQALC